MTIRNNQTMDKLASGGTVFGTMIFEFLSPGLPQIARNAGADFLLYDMEHSGFSVDQIKNQCALCRGIGLTPLVRPPGKDYQFAARLLDIGAMGLMFQMLETAEEARELVSYTRYPPRGRRGAIFGGAHDDYDTDDIAAAIAGVEERTMVIGLIETERGVANVDEIMAVEGIDAAHLGHADLSISLGLPGQFEHPTVQAGYDAIVNAAGKHGKPAGTLVADVAGGEDMMQRGYRMISYKFDIGLMQDALGDGIAALSGSNR
jgi:2-keto-3-deoxy-L-rhamnonate aldolase RhmA